MVGSAIDGVPLREPTAGAAPLVGIDESVFSRLDDDRLPPSPAMEKVPAGERAVAHLRSYQLLEEFEHIVVGLLGHAHERVLHVA